MLGIIYRTWVLARQDEIQDDIEDRRVAATPSFDAEDDAVIPMETSEFPLTMLGADGGGVSDAPIPDSPVPAGGRDISGEAAAREEKPGSATIDKKPEGDGT